jgi:hypothetical protein
LFPLTEINLLVPEIKQVPEEGTLPGPFGSTGGLPPWTNWFRTGGSEQSVLRSLPPWTNWFHRRGGSKWSVHSLQRGVSKWIAHSLQRGGANGVQTLSPPDVYQAGVARCARCARRRWFDLMVVFTSACCKVRVCLGL